jgi:iron-sulfur cluster repair protein YtfE (RIC family)
MLFQLKRSLTAHALAEEDGVYPLLRTKAEHEERACELYAEHADIKTALFEIEAALNSDGTWRERVDGLRTLIAGHAAKEEGEEFPLLRRRLSPQEMAKISGLASGEKAMVV